MSYFGFNLTSQRSQISKEGQFDTSYSSRPEKKLSMRSLITWNISKVLETCPSIDLKSAMRSAHEQLERESRDGAPMMSLQPEEQHLTCALLAWHQLGHKNTDSLYEFIESNQNRHKFNENESNIKVIKQSSSIMKGSLTGSPSFDSNSLKGPVVKLPVETKIVMRVENYQYNHEYKPKNNETKNRDVKSKINDACCMDPACAATLPELDAVTSELRTRAARLGKREAERIELLERAETAWKDLEVSYQRRLRLAEEKENDIKEEVKRMLEERNSYKNVCKILMEDLRKRGIEAEEVRDRLTKLDKEVCSRACERLQLSKESAQGDAAVVEQHCRIAQLDKDLQFKEQQARRRILSLESEIECARGLSLEAERAIRADLGVIKENTNRAAEELKDEENKNNLLKSELDSIRQKKSEIMKDMDTCKTKCDTELQEKLNELESKKKQLVELKNKVIECQCKLPLDASIEVRRTPSLAALCRCTSEDRLSESCSCTSLRSQLMSNLLADLFEGLQWEVEETGSLMPCQLLKCLEDRHDWDRGSAVKTNLRDYFSQLLVGELDIAIATSIEKYHAKWVGGSCADKALSQIKSDNEEELQESVLQFRAQKLATELAEQLFKERADELIKRAREIVSNGPPPCNCKPQTQQAAVYSCLVKTPTSRKDNETSHIKRTLNDITQLRAQIEDLKKESIKKEDLRHMEDKLTRLINRASRLNAKLKNKNKYDHVLHTSTDDKPGNGKNDGPVNNNKKTIKLDDFDSCYLKDKISLKHTTGRIKKHITKKDVKNVEQSYAVNVCLCNTQQISNNITNVLKVSHKQKKDLRDTSNIKQTRPISHLSKHIKNINNISKKISCLSECICFNKVPSNTSIDELFKTLTEGNSNFDQNLNKSIQELNTKSLEMNSISRTTDSKTGLTDIISRNINDINVDSQIINNSHAKIKYKDNYEENFRNLAIPTASEYMGAINLDKSNEHLCQSVINSKGGQDYNVIKTTSGTEDISANKSKSNLKGRKDNKQCIVEEIKNQLYFDNNTKKSSKINEENISVFSESYISDKMGNSNTFANDCKYRVKFLGVTVADISDNALYPRVESNKQSPTNSNYYDATQIHSKNDVIASHSCKNAKIKEFELAKDTKESKRSISTMKNFRESCICCNNKANVSDIEVNAFNLLEEHLKKKIIDFKHTIKSSISNEDEEKIFLNILNKVKHLITSTTSELSCKCFIKNHEGSWLRAYGLLKEYLKIKIERVQCSCTTSNNTDTILPNILEKVSALIERDFERLKIKYESESINGNKNIILKSSNHQIKNARIDKDHKDVDIQLDYNEESLLKKYKCLKNTGDVSAQVSFNLNTQHKSSDPIYENQNINNAEKKVSCKFGNNVYVTDCDCRYNHNVTSNLQYDTFNKEDSLNKENYINLSTYSDPLNIPYIGYTLNCSCDYNLEPCVCSKSTAKVKDEQINYIWQSNQYFPKSLSYIMSRIPVIDDSEHRSCIKIDKAAINEDKLQEFMVCKNLNTDYETNIVLKDSFDRNNATYKDSNTPDEIKADFFSPKIKRCI